MSDDGELVDSLLVAYTRLLTLNFGLGLCKARRRKKLRSVLETQQLQLLIFDADASMPHLLPCRFLKRNLAKGRL